MWNSVAMGLESAIFEALQQFQIPAIYVGTFFLSEAVIIPSAVLAKQGVFHWYTIYLVALIATISSDIAWFKGAKVILRITHRLGQYEKKIHRLMHTVERMTGKRTYLFLMVFKFFYGFRGLTIIALSMRHYNFWMFVGFSAIGTAIWLFVIMGIGWLVAAGLNLLPAVHTLQYIIMAAILLVVGFKLITVWLGRELAEEEEKVEREEHHRKSK